MNSRKNKLDIISDKIIIDGLDAAGKSTLAKQIAEEFNFDVVRETVDTPNNMKWYSEKYKKPNTVHDRSFLCEKVFPIVFGRKAKITANETKELIAQIKRDNVMVIIGLNDCLPAMKIFETRGEDIPYDYNSVQFMWLRVYSWLVQHDLDVVLYYLNDNLGKWVLHDKRTI